MHLERKSARGLMDKVSDFEAEGLEFDPHQRQILFFSAKLLPVAKMQKIKHFQGSLTCFSHIFFSGDK